MLNRVVLVGRLTKDPDFKMTTSGVAVATFTIAVNRTFANNQGEREADFIPIVVWRRQAETVNQYLKKGNLVGIDGRMQVRHYEGQDGKRVYVTEVVAETVQFLESKGSGQSNNDFGHNNQNQSYNQGQNFYQEQRKPNNFIKHEEDPFANMGGKIDITEDDLPF